MESLTPNEIKLLRVLQHPMISVEMFNAADIPIPSGRKSLTSLLKKRLVIPVYHEGKDRKYARSGGPEIEQYLHGIEYNPEIQFDWRGEKQNLLEYLASAAKNMSGASNPGYVVWALASHVWSRSHRMATGGVTQGPSAREVRSILVGIRVKLLTLLDAVDNMLKAPIWDDNTEVWKYISTSEVEDSVEKRDNASNDIFKAWVDGRFK